MDVGLVVSVELRRVESLLGLKPGLANYSERLEEREYTFEKDFELVRTLSVYGVISRSCGRSFI